MVCLLQFRCPWSDNSCWEELWIRGSSSRCSSPQRVTGIAHRITSMTCTFVWTWRKTGPPCCQKTVLPLYAAVALRDRCFFVVIVRFQGSTWGKPCLGTPWWWSVGWKVELTAVWELICVYIYIHIYIYTCRLCGMYLANHIFSG